MIRTLDELKAALTPGTVFYVISPSLYPDRATVRKVQMLDATGIHVTNPEHAPPPINSWNSSKMHFGEPSDYYFTEKEFAWVWRNDKGDVAGAFRCSFENPDQCEATNTSSSPNSQKSATTASATPSAT